MKILQGWVREGDVPPPVQSAEALAYLVETLYLVNEDVDFSINFPKEGGD